MKKVFPFILFIVIAFSSYSQISKKEDSGDYDLSAPDTIIFIPKRPALAASEIFAVNTGVWAFDRYIVDGHYAYISLHSMKRNLRKGFYWDNDNFQTNLFNHPYHGSIYFNSARANGMSFLQSGLFTLGGSFMWEIFMECELPSTNDLIATPVGGMAFGEVLYRISDFVVDHRTAGIHRFGNELLGLILSPGRSLTRILTGEAWKVSPYSRKQFAPADVSFEVSTGIRIMELFEPESELLDESVGGFLNFKLEYGDIYEESERPFDYFQIHFGFNVQKKQPFIGNINLMGKLYGAKVWENKGHELHAGLFQHLDYYDSDTLSTGDTRKDTKTPFEVGTPASVGIGVLYKWENPSKGWKLHAGVHGNAIILGSSLSDYYRGNERKYNWGSGLALKYGIDISWKNRFLLEYQMNHNKIFTWRGYDPDPEKMDYRTLNVQGDKSQSYYNIMHIKLGWHFKKNLEIGYELYDYFRNTRYDYFPNVSSNTTDVRFVTTYRF
ncbi:MAG: DUF3943 domain-containing protein [Tannerella sp.]|jgi:hypothetical protein|nr:DUF3943 domain-containing protein [Tannerella sp.]